MIDFSLLAKAVEPCKNALIVGHSHPDGDCVGSALALACYIEAVGGKAAVIFPEKAPERLEFLLGDTNVLSALPENLGDFDVICVDVASPTQLGGLKDALCSSVALRIDHHGVSTSYAEREFVDPSAAATGEIIFDLFEYALKEKKITEIPKKALLPLFGAISSDTGCFKYANVTPKTHLRAAKLIEYGAPAEEINRLLFDTKSLRQLRAEAVAVNALHTYKDGKISTVAIDLDVYDQGFEMSDFETAVDIARSVQGSEVSVVAKAVPSGGLYRISLRSIGIDVSKIAALFGGGGHIRAAGCSVEAASATDAIEKVVDKIEV